MFRLPSASSSVLLPSSSPFIIAGATINVRGMPRTSPAVNQSILLSRSCDRDERLSIVGCSSLPFLFLAFSLFFSLSISVDSDRTLLDAHSNHRAILSLRISLVASRHCRWLSDHPVRVGRRVAVVVEVLLLNHRRGHHRRQMGYTGKN